MLNVYKVYKVLILLMSMSLHTMHISIISLPHLPTGFSLRQVPRKVRYRLLSRPQWVMLYKIYDLDRIV